MASDQRPGGRLVAWASGREQRKGLRARDAAILIVVVWFLAIVVFGIAEHLVEPKTFPTVWLGMWWSLVTVTTVGYGDVVPVGTAGRIIASFLLLGGLAFLTVIIAMITGGFVSRYQRKSDAASEERIFQRLEELGAAVEELHVELRELRRDNGIRDGIVGPASRLAARVAFGVTAHSVEWACANVVAGPGGVHVQLRSQGDERRGSSHGRGRARQRRPQAVRRRSRRLDRQVAALGPPRIRLHDLWHSYATHRLPGLDRDAASQKRARTVWSGPSDLHLLW